MSGFCFQAEDGIRDAQESRGLGDVYKRQRHHRVADGPARQGRHVPGLPVPPGDPRGLGDPVPVSYTHLTLPTIYSV